MKRNLKLNFMPGSSSSRCRNRPLPPPLSSLLLRSGHTREKYKNLEKSPLGELRKGVAGWLRKDGKTTHSWRSELKEFLLPQKNVRKTESLLAGFHWPLLEEAFLPYRCCKKIIFLLDFGPRGRSLLSRSGFAHESPFSLPKKPLSFSRKKRGG